MFKDQKIGTTQYYGDDCKPPHFPPREEEWEKRSNSVATEIFMSGIADKFKDVPREVLLKGAHGTLCDFIRSLLQKEYERGRIDGCLSEEQLNHIKGLVYTAGYERGQEDCIKMACDETYHSSLQEKARQEGYEKGAKEDRARLLSQKANAHDQEVRKLLIEELEGEVAGHKFMMPSNPEYKAYNNAIDTVLALLKSKKETK